MIEPERPYRVEREPIRRRRIRFLGPEFVLVGREGDAALMESETACDLCERAYAYLADGKVRRYGELIGIEADVEYLEAWR